MENVKASGPTLRKERAANTRRLISDSGRQLFFQKGYVATTLQEIAEAAGVAVQTVYAVFGSKAGILRVLRDLAISQPEADAMFVRALRATTLDESLNYFAQSIRLRWEKAGDIVQILQDAGMADPAIREEIEVALRARRNGINQYVLSLQKNFALAIDVDQTTAILLALTLPEVHAEFVNSHGWTEDEYEKWLSRALLAFIAEQLP